MKPTKNPTKPRLPIIRQIGARLVLSFLGSLLASCSTSSLTTSGTRASRNPTTVQADYYDVMFNGNKVGMLMGGGMEFYDAKGTRVSQLTRGTGAGDEPSLTLARKDGERIRISVGKNGNSPQIYLHGANNYPRAWFNGTSDGAELRMADNLGRVRMRLVTDRKGGRIEFVNDTGKVVKTIGETTTP